MARFVGYGETPLIGDPWLCSEVGQMDGQMVLRQGTRIVQSGPKMHR